MTVRFQKTSKGEVAILPRREYEALAAKAAEADEDAGTARIVARAQQEVAAGAPLIPLEVANAIADGENCARAIRKWRGMTQAELAAASGLGQGYISDIESGRRQGSIEALRALADALRVPLDLL